MDHLLEELKYNEEAVYMAQSLSFVLEKGFELLLRQRAISLLSIEVDPLSTRLLAVLHLQKLTEHASPPLCVGNGILYGTIELLEVFQRLEETGTGTKTKTG